MAKDKEKKGWIDGVHRVKKQLATGETREYHYVWRGGPKFWDSTMPFGPGAPEYSAAHTEVSRGNRIPDRAPNAKLTSTVIARYRSSAQFVKLAERTQQDYNKYLDSFEEEFGEDPIKMFEATEVLAEIEDWKNQWGHSARQYDYATTVATRLLNWAKKTDGAIASHPHVGIERLYKSDRADIIWLPAEIKALRAAATEREERIVVAASEGGLAPQDIGILTRDHVQDTAQGRRLFFKRTKTGKRVSIPVTPALDWLIDTTPEDQHYLVVSLTGRRLTALRASQIVRDLIARVNKKAETGRGTIRVRDELRCYDMRGTAATELLRAGCTLNEIAVTMGWGLRHAANIIEKYAALVPEVSDEVLAKLMAARKAVKLDQEEDA